VRTRRLGTALASALATLTALVATATSTPVAAAHDAGFRAVFVQTNDPSGNQSLAYHRRETAG
jgi:hypothetical protein